jgi:Zn-dependent protease
MSHDTDYMRSSWSTIITVFTILNWLDGQLFQHLYDIIAIKIGSLVVFFLCPMTLITCAPPDPVFTILNWLDGQLFQHLYDIIAIKIGSLMVFFRVQLSMSIGIGFYDKWY